MALPAPLRRSLAPAALLLALASPALAQQPAPDPSPSPSPPPPKVDVSGYVDVYYLYDTNRTDPALRAFDVQHDTFSLSAADVAFSRTPGPGSRLGFAVDLFFGKAADLTAAFEPASDGKEIYKHLKQAYLSLQTGKVQWDVGKFVTPMGAEVLESQNDWNYSRDLLFTLATPLYHLGLRGTWNVNDRLAVAGSLVNGWNNASENNSDKTVHLSVTLKPTPSLTWVVNDMFGKEAPQEAPVRDVRNLFDTTLTWTVLPRLSLQANADYGTEGAVKWGGVAAYAKYQAIPAWAVAARYEYVDDTHGSFMTIGGRAQSFTLTSDHLVAGALHARLEYRLDHVDRPFFEKPDGTLVSNQATFTVGLVCSFGGKI